MEVEPITVYQDVEYFDSISEEPTYPLSWFHPHLDPSLAYRLKVGAFSASTMFWDSIVHLLSSPPPLTRRIRRRHHPITVPADPNAWMLLTSCLIIGQAAFQGTMPALKVQTPHEMIKHAQLCGLEAYERMVRLEEMLVFNAETLLQYTAWNYLTVHNILDKRKKAKTEKLSKTKQATSTGNSPFDPFGLHELCSRSVFIDCVTRSPEAEVKYERKQSANGPTGLQKGLSSEAYQVLASDPQALMTIGGGQRKSVIFDTGASLGITFDKEDFNGPLTVREGDLRLGGMAQGLKIAGVGPVTWTFHNPYGSKVKIRSQYYVPEAKVRLISPQRLFNKIKGVTGKFEGNEDTFTLQFDGGHRLVIEYAGRNHLPIGYATVGDDLQPTINPQANLSILDETNQNITAGHRLLLNWHGRFGHLNFPAVQRILRQFPFVSIKFAAAAKFDLTDFRCEVCQYAKAHRRTTHGKRTQANDDREGSLKAEHLGPGVRVSVDHFESRLLGRTRDSYGKPSSAKYKGGCIFVDHGMGYLHVEHQLGFSAFETLRAKQSFENMAFEHGVVVQSYLTDSGAFKANAFVRQIRDHGH